jgi:hypothetical protein
VRSAMQSTACLLLQQGPFVACVLVCSNEGTGPPSTNEAHSRLTRTPVLQLSSFAPDETRLAPSPRFCELTARASLGTHNHDEQHRYGPAGLTLPAHSTLPPLSTPSVRHTARSHAAARSPLFSLSSFSVSLRGPQRMDEYGPPVRIPLWNAWVRHGEAEDARGSPAEFSAIVRRWGFFANALVCVPSLLVCMLLLRVNRCRLHPIRMSAVPTSFAAEEAQSLPAASTSTSHAEPQEGKIDNKPADQPVLQNRPAGEAAAAAAMDDSASRVAPVQGGSDRMMDSGPETLDQPDEGVVPNEQGANAAAADRGAEHGISLSNDPSVGHTTHTRAHCCLVFACCLLLPLLPLVISA